MADSDEVVDRAASKLGGVALGAGVGGLVAAPIALAVGAALAPATLGLSLPITIGLTALGGWIGHKATKAPEQYVK
jgi:hypothetical protein